jgi:serine/threonine-protein kinase
VHDATGNPATSAAASQAGSRTDPTDAEVVATEAETSPSPYARGVELGGRYRLSARLGAGGMGEVWEAEHVVLRRMLAIKLLRGDDHDSGHAERLQREAEIVARLEHPNIVTVTDFGRAPSGWPFVVMERLRGRTLSALLRERGSLPWTQARDIAVQICAGLACAHAAGIIHRDLKPSNVFVLDDPHDRLPIKIIDFGLAKATELGPNDRALTHSGMVFGTPAYMAPEQARGEPLDGGVDIYALGAILFEMIAGQRLWKRATVPQLLYCHLFEPPPSLRSIVAGAPADLEAVIARCLCKDRALRWPDAESLRVALLGVGTDKGDTFVPRERIPRPTAELEARYAVATPGAVRPRVAFVAPLVALVVVLAGVIGTLAWRFAPTALREDQAPAAAIDHPTVEESIAPPAATPPAVVAPTPAPDPPPPATTPTDPPQPAATPPTTEPQPKPVAKPRSKPSRPKTPPTPPEPSEPDPPTPPTKAPKRDGEVYQPFQ